MITPELQNYVQSQLSAGVTPDAIRSALLAQGWNATDVDNALPSITPPVTVEPAPTETVGTPTAKPSSKLGLLLSILVLVLILGGGGLYFYTRNKNPATTPSPSLSTTSTPLWSTYKTTQQSVAFQFDYPSTWIPSETSKILTVSKTASESEKEFILLDELTGPTAASTYSEYSDAQAFASAFPNWTLKSQNRVILGNKPAVEIDMVSSPSKNTGEVLESLDTFVQIDDQTTLQIAVEFTGLTSDEKSDLKAVYNQLVPTWKLQ